MIKKRDEEKKKERYLLLVGIPAYNEEESIAGVIRRIPRNIEKIAEVRVVVADDGSTDNTRRIARDAGAEVVTHGQNLGVGASFQTIYRHALEIRADILVTIDADGQFDPEDIPKIINPILENESLVCTASRFSRKEIMPEMPWVKKWGNRQVARLVSGMTGIKYADVSCGYRAYSREALCRLTVYHSFTYTHETFLDLAAKNIKIKEIPLKIKGVREHGKSKVAASVLRYGFRTGAIMLRTYRDHQPIKLSWMFGLPLFIVSVVLLVMSFMQFYTTGYWLKWAAFTAAALFALFVSTIIFGFMADMLTRIRKNQEEIVYWVRQNSRLGEDSLESDCPRERADGD